ncbi:glycosylphosphatidylinositol anchor biosynthesis [Ascochyta rabiei]|uniref:Mannosyltransferase n=1 Tax=Didymella rabiei TaxID=5454 RepID=A0A162YI70_DIDRA|nr:glycosylphosphatidylinositol anchor biosynthesis [Ascochyta rabiei]KZM20058.1 transferase [Ascochyta rabiei]UPX17165.1 glycosylphosphatidylinositol anchor biosynthesis [Ascochyta rabiei]
MPSASDSADATTASRTGAPPERPSTSYRDSPLRVFALLLAFRTVNALTLRTFFQPDEFFQSLEPAWRLAMGGASNAWITWEWKTLLRSSLHPALFAAAYRVAAQLADVCGFSLPVRAELLLATPKVVQAVSAALLDCYTWQLAEKVYGRGSRTALTALAISVCSPWQWFCSTRTLSNCLETTLTAIAVYHWPWHWSTLAGHGKTLREGKTSVAAQGDLGSVLQLRLSLLLAASACILRPTNVLIWLPISALTTWQASKRLRYILIREVALCGSAVLACSVLSDRLYYGSWALPPLRFLYFNIAQSLAVFYGKNRPDYYLTEGLPLLLTTALPFAVVGLYQSFLGSPSPSTASTKGSSISKDNATPIVSRDILSRLGWTCMTMAITLSLISHKEVRFLYPILPFLHVISAGPLVSFYPTRAPLSRKAIVGLLLAVNIVVAGYVSQIHQRGVIDVVHHIRHKHEARNSLASNTSPSSPSTHVSNTTVGFLMPCHSTPWRSHLVYAEINAWALTCEPPLHVPLAERATYLDEADEFYINPGPQRWLRDNMESVQTVTAGGSRSGQFWTQHDPKFKAKYRRPWPQNLVFFEALEAEMKTVLGESRYRECWRGFNSHFHDDSRRVGDVIVWCLDE